jgi:lactoylglutathione lyase
MTLNHVNLTVTNVEETSEFLARYFGLRAVPESRRERAFAVMFDDQGLVLSLTQAKRAAEVKYPPSFHIGFMQENEERVNQINRRLRADGFDVKPPKRLHAWTFYLRAPGGFMIEVLC